MPTVTTAIVLAGGALFAKPSLAAMYALCAIACLLLASDVDESGWSASLTTLALTMSGLTAWSGLVASSFPLPISLPVIVLLVVGIVIGTTRTSHGWAPSVFIREKVAPSVSEAGGARGASALASAVVAGLAVSIILLHPVFAPAGDVLADDVRLAAGESVTLDLPAGARGLRIRVAGGNVAGLDAGVVVGVAHVQPGNESLELRIGDFADWGSNRREHFLSANNPRPMYPAGRANETGRQAFLSGTGVVRMRVENPSRVTIEALPSIGANGRLLIEAVEVEQ